MAQYGADTAQLRSLSKTVAKAADQLNQIVSQVTSQLSSTRWQGPDAERFRAQWNSASTKALHTATQDLQAASIALQRNAKEQDQASAAAGGSTAAAGSPGVGSGGPSVTEGTIYDGLGLAGAANGVIDDSKTLHDAVNGVSEAAHTGVGSDLLGAGAAALDAQDLGKRWQGIEDGNMGNFLGGLLDVAGGTISVGGMVAPEAAIPLAGLDLGVTGLSAGLDDLEKGK